MVTITRHIFINIFLTKHFSAVKFAIGYEKNMRFLVIAKSQKFEKEVENIGLGSFKGDYTSRLGIFIFYHNFLTNS